LEGLRIETLCIFHDVLVFLWPFGIDCIRIVYFVVIWYIRSRFGKFCQDKCGKTAQKLMLKKLALVVKSSHIYDLYVHTNQCDQRGENERGETE
jgi:hypothetical protein